MFDRAACLAIRMAASPRVDITALIALRRVLRTRRMLACAAALYRMSLLLVQGGTPATRIRELPVRHKYRRPPSHQTAVKQLDLFGLPGAKHPTPEFEWQQLPEETRQMVTGLMVHLLVNHQRRDREPSSTGRHGDV
jgi:hypothetical protein